MIKKNLIFVLLFVNSLLFAQEKQKIQPFIAFELGQAVFNDFKSYSGEVGLKLGNNHLLRLTHMNIHLSEAHLSSGFAIAVDGDNVTGTQFGFEAFYDFPVFWNGFYISPSVGWYRNEYRHTFLNDELNKRSATIGVAISYRETNIFGIKGLYYTLSFPMRMPFNPIEKTLLGDTVIKNNTFDSNIFFFIGFEF